MDKDLRDRVMALEGYVERMSLLMGDMVLLISQLAGEGEERVKSLKEQWDALK